MELPLSTLSGKRRQQAHPKALCHTSRSGSDLSRAHGLLPLSQVLLKSRLLFGSGHLAFFWFLDKD